MIWFDYLRGFDSKYVVTEMTKNRWEGLKVVFRSFKLYLNLRLFTNLLFRLRANYPNQEPRGCRIIGRENMGGENGRGPVRRSRKGK